MSVGEKSTSEVLATLQEKGDYFMRLTIIEKKRLGDLEEALTHIRRETNNYRSQAKSTAIDIMNLNIMTPNPAYQRADGCEIQKQANLVTNKMLHILEAKLNKLLQRHSDEQEKNRKKKVEIDHMRRLRLQTDTAHKHYETELAITKEKVEILLKECTQVMESRENIIEVKEALEKQNTEEQRKFEEEYEEMGYYIKDQNNKLETTLLKERNSDIIDDFEFQCGDLSVEEEDEMAGRVGQLTSFVASEQTSLANIQQTIYNYEKMFAELRRITQTENLDEIISTYSAQEEEMFSLYNYIQTQNTEIELALETKHRIEEEIRSYDENQAEQEMARQSILDGLASKLQASIEATAICEAENAANHDCVHQVAKKVQSLFFKLQCDQMDSSKGNSSSNKGSKNSGSMSRNESKIAILTGQGVTESNVLDYMGAVEQRAVDIIAEYIKSHGNEGLRSPTPGPSSPMQWPSSTRVDLPEFEDNDELFNEVENEDSKPIDLNTFKDKLKKKVSMNGSGKSLF
jgi:coiled-coil domain-containing protein 63/114